MALWTSPSSQPTQKTGSFSLAVNRMLLKDFVWIFWIDTQRPSVVGEDRQISLAVAGDPRGDKRRVDGVEVVLGSVGWVELGCLVASLLITSTSNAFGLVLDCLVLVSRLVDWLRFVWLFASGALFVMICFSKKCWVEAKFLDFVGRPSSKSKFIWETFYLKVFELSKKKTPCCLDVVCWVSCMSLVANLWWVILIPNRTPLEDKTSEKPKEMLKNRWPLSYNDTPKREPKRTCLRVYKMFYNVKTATKSKGVARPKKFLISCKHAFKKKKKKKKSQSLVVVGVFLPSDQTNSQELPGSSCCAKIDITRWHLTKAPWVAKGLGMLKCVGCLFGLLLCFFWKAMGQCECSSFLALFDDVCGHSGYHSVGLTKIYQDT